MGLYDALYGTQGSEQDYLAQDPYFTGARSVAQWQMKPQNDSEAIWMPALQGLLTGVLGGMGRENARQAMWDDYRSSPLLQAYTSDIAKSVGPLASGDAYATALENYDTHNYTSDAAPEGWNARTGKGDLIMAAIAEQAVKEEEQKKADAKRQLENTIAAQENAAENQMDIEKFRLGGANGIPQSMRDNLFKEQGDQQKATEIETVLRNAYKTARDVDPLKQLNPMSDDYAKIDAAGSTIIGSIQGIWKGPMSDAEQRRMQALLPSRLDTDSQIKVKEQQMIDLLKANQAATPILDEMARKASGGGSTGGGHVVTGPDGKKYRIID